MATGFLSTDAIARLRTRAVGGFDATCTVQRRASSAGPYLDVAELTGLACSFAAEGATNEGVAADASLATTRFVVRLNPDELPVGVASIGSADRLKITHQRRGIVSPLLLSVVGPQERGEYEITRHIIATRTTVGG